jgi:hypothetical protein
MITEYVVELSRAELGLSVAVLVAEPYVTVAATRADEESSNCMLDPLTVVGSRASLKVAVIDDCGSTPDEPAVGETDCTVGGVVSGPAGTNTTSTQ